MKAGLWLMVAIFAIASSSAPAVAQDKQEPAKSHAVLKGTLIGLAAGVAGGALFFGLTNCHYGSDSGAAMVGCGAVTGGIIAGGGIIGHMIGHRIEKRGATPASTTNSSSPWRAPEFVRASTGLDLGLPRSPSVRATDVFSAATGRSSLTNSIGAHLVLHKERERLSVYSLSVLSGSPLNSRE